MRSFPSLLVFGHLRRAQATTGRTASFLLAHPSQVTTAILRFAIATEINTHSVIDD